MIFVFVQCCTFHLPLIFSNFYSIYCYLFPNFMFTYYFRLRIRPRCLLDVTKRDTKTRVLGMDVDVPIGFAPAAMQKMAHPDGEIGGARGKDFLESAFLWAPLHIQCSNHFSSMVLVLWMYFSPLISPLFFSSLFRPLFLVFFCFLISTFIYLFIFFNSSFSFSLFFLLCVFSHFFLLIFFFLSLQLLFDGVWSYISPLIISSHSFIIM